MRLIACADCNRQYDVTSHEIGDKLLCLCGQKLTVTEHLAHEPTPLRCPSCGGPLDENRKNCRYCLQGFSIEERTLSTVCPCCLARMSATAQFCMECGVNIDPQSIVAVPDGKTCPRCDSALRTRHCKNTSFIECSHCRGIWLSPNSFSKMVKNAEESKIALQDFSAQQENSPFASETPEFKYLSCLVCDDKMVPRSLGAKSRVIVDVCGKHGLWFDHKELERSLAYLRAGHEHNLSLEDGKITYKIKQSPQPRSRLPMGDFRPKYTSKSGWWLAELLFSVIGSIFED